MHTFFPEISLGHGSGKHFNFTSCKQWLKKSTLTHVHHYKEKINTAVILAFEPLLFLLFMIYISVGMVQQTPKTNSKHQHG